jgi:hypothetical protein
VPQPIWAKLPSSSARTYRILRSRPHTAPVLRRSRPLKPPTLCCDSSRISKTSRHGR